MNGSPRLRRATIAALLLALPLTLAPRTSQDLDNGWRAIILSDTFEGSRNVVSSVTLVAVPPADVPVRTDLTFAITGGSWTLVSAPPGCEREGSSVVCILRAGELRRQHVVSVTVSGSPSLTYTLSTPVPG